MLFADNSDKSLWRLKALVRRWTGRRVISPAMHDGYPYWWTQDEVTIDPLSSETVLHEICHYIIATPEERELENLGLPPTGDDGVQGVREGQTLALEIRIAEAADYYIGDVLYDQFTEECGTKKKGRSARAYFAQAAERLAAFELEHPKAERLIVRALQRAKD